MRDFLWILDRIEGFFDRWRHPVYRIVGPSADREYLYREGDRILFVCFDWVSGAGIDLVLYASGIDHWEAPHEQEKISDEKQQEILQRFEQMLKSQKARYEVK